MYISERCIRLTARTLYRAERLRKDRLALVGRVTLDQFPSLVDRVIVVDGPDGRLGGVGERLRETGDLVVV